MERKQIIFGFLGLLGASILVLKDIKKEKSWHDFFKPLPPKESKLLEKSGPLAITKETNQRIKGSGRFQSEEVRCTLFEDMSKSIKKEEEEPKVTPEPVDQTAKVQPEPVKSPEKVTIKPKKVIQKVQKLKKEVPVPKEEKDYFPVSFERKGRKKDINQVSNSYISGCLYGTQELKHGRSITIVVREPFIYQGKEIPKGALLYGVVAFGKERVLSKLETAVFGKTTLEISIALYDADYTIGLLVENLHPFLDSAQDKLLSKAASSGSNSWIKEISSSAVDALKSIKKEPKVTLENRRKVLLKPIKK